MTRPLSALFLLFAFMSSACSAYELVDAEVSHTIAIDFDDMQADKVEETARDGIVIHLLDQEDFEAYHDQLLCVGLNTSRSSITVTRLEAPGLESVLDLQLEIAAYPNGEWIPIMDFTAYVTDGDSIPLNDSAFGLYVEGVDTLERLALEDDPTYEFRVSGAVPHAVEDLEVEFHLQLQLGTDHTICRTAL